MKSKNVILITIDCLRLNHLGVFGYQRKTSPFIDSLSKKSLFFENAFANGPFTIASFVSIFASTFPLNNGRYISPQKLLFLSEVLSENGIKTGAIHSNPYLSSLLGWNKGFEFFEDFLGRFEKKKIKKVKPSFKSKILKKFPILGKIKKEIFSLIKKKKETFTLPYASAKEITDKAIKWIEETIPSSFFLWLHYMDLHEPYIILNGEVERKYSKYLTPSLQKEILKLKKENLKEIIDIYDDKLFWIDQNIKRLVKFLEEKNILENTLLILTADHGQEFYEHGSFGHKASFFEEIIRIPLFIYSSKISPRRVKSLVSQIDLSPTILDFFGIPLPQEYIGKSLFSPSQRDFVLSEASFNEKGVYIEAFKIQPPKYIGICLRTERWKYIFSTKKETFLFDLKNDPQERENLKGKYPKLEKEFRKIIDQRLEEIMKKEIVEKLREEEKL